MRNMTKNNIIAALPFFELSYSQEANYCSSRRFQALPSFRRALSYILCNGSEQLNKLRASQAAQGVSSSSSAWRFSMCTAITLWIDVDTPRDFQAILADGRLFLRHAICGVLLSQSALHYLFHQLKKLPPVAHLTRGSHSSSASAAHCGAAAVRAGHAASRQCTKGNQSPWCGCSCCAQFMTRSIEHSSGPCWQVITPCKRRQMISDL